MDDFTPWRDWLKARLKKLRKTQADLAAALGVERTAISGLVNGARRVRVDEVPIIAQLLDVSEIELLGRMGIEEAADIWHSSANGRVVPLDRDLMAQVIASSHVWLAERDMVMAPSDIADLVIALYELVLREKGRDPDAPVGVDDYADIIAPRLKRRSGNI